MTGMDKNDCHFFCILPCIFPRFIFFSTPFSPCLSTSPPSLSLLFFFIDYIPTNNSLYDTYSPSDLRSRHNTGKIMTFLSHPLVANKQRKKHRTGTFPPLPLFPSFSISLQRIEAGTKGCIWAAPVNRTRSYSKDSRLQLRTRKTDVPVRPCLSRFTLSVLFLYYTLL